MAKDHKTSSALFRATLRFRHQYPFSLVHVIRFRSQHYSPEDVLAARAGWTTINSGSILRP